MSEYHSYSEFVQGTRRFDDEKSFTDLQKFDREPGKHGVKGVKEFSEGLLIRYGVRENTELRVQAKHYQKNINAFYDDEHHRDQVLSGWGDIKLGFRHYFGISEHSLLTLYGGISLPTGRIEKLDRSSFLSHETAVALDILVPPHSHDENFGTGTFDPYLGLEALKIVGEKWIFYANLGFEFPLYENRYDYQNSPSMFLTVSGAYRFTKGKPFIAALALDTMYSGRDRIEGDDLLTQVGRIEGSFWVPDTGAFNARLRPGFHWNFRDNWRISVEATIPIFEHARMGHENSDVQLSEDVGLIATLAWKF